MVIFISSKTAMIRFVVQTGDPRPIFKQIVEGVRRSIAKGEIAAGAKLPSVRALAMQFSINPNTVAKAYAELAAQDLVHSRLGLGLFAKDPRQLLSNGERAKRLRQAVEHCANEVMYLGYSHEELLQAYSDELDSLTTITAEKKHG